MADIKPVEDAAENTESVLDLQELSTEDSADDVQAHHGCISFRSMIFDNPLPY